MKLTSKTRNRRASHHRSLAESGQTLSEVLIASSILTITISGFTTGIIGSNQITHQASLRKAAENVIVNDLESTVRRRFYTFRCKQGPCKDSIEESDKSLMYYDSENKENFIERCNTRDLARELLEEEEAPFTDGEQDIHTSLNEKDITITRTISLDDSNNNRAIIEYEAEKNNKTIATVKTTIVPNAVHWCS